MSYLRFLNLAVLVVLVLIAVGLRPTVRLAGDTALPAMMAGCLISLVAAAAAGWVLVTRKSGAPDAQVYIAFQAMAARLGVVVVLGVVAAVSGEFRRPPLLFWLATSYVALLPLEVKLAIRK